MRFGGGYVQPFGCEYFVLRGEAGREGKLAFPLTTRHEDGSATKYEGDKINDPLGAQLVFAGIVPSDADYITAAGGEGLSRWKSASGLFQGLAFGTLGGLTLAWGIARLRRRRAADGPMAPPRRSGGASRRSSGDRSRRG